MDFTGILKYIAENFGSRQAAIYKTTLIEAISELANGPDLAGSVARDEILEGLRTIHIARRGRRGRHLIMFRAVEDRIEIVRILHDAMDLARHIPREG